MMIKKVFLPGEEWVYYKIYINEVIADKILVTKIVPIVNIAIKRGIIDRWFFIRYYDPDSHIRIRFHLSDNQRMNELINLVNSKLHPLIKTGLIRNLSIESYERELERYGNEKIIAFEEIFFNDSSLTVLFLKTEPSEQEKIIESMSRLYFFITMIIPDNSAQLNFVNSMKISYLKEFNISDPININKEYRELRPLLSEIKTRKEHFYSIFHFNNNILKDTAKTYSFLSSVIHMSINRLFNTKQREYEMISYIYMEKYLKFIQKMNK